MIGNALAYIRKRLDAHLREAQGMDSGGDTADRVVFLEGDKLDPLAIPQRSIAMLVVNVQEDREFRDADRFQRRLGKNNGVKSEDHYPDIRLELAVLFIANFKDYVTAWNQLSQVLSFFQQNPVFDTDSDKNLPSEIDRLSNELCSQSFQEQNQLWSTLRTSLRPALLHRFRLITLRGRAMSYQAPPILPEKVQTYVKHKDDAPPLKPINTEQPNIKQEDDAN
jgi:hypothetical protein